MNITNWLDRRVLVTGGASFIGSHLVDALVARGARVRIVDDYSSGQRGNVAAHLAAGRIEALEGDLRDDGVARRAVDGSEVVFHLAANHGGRGYVDLHQAACASNLLLDGIVFRTCVEARVGKVVYASSACVYPPRSPARPGEAVYLREEMVGPPYDADNMYGWTKLMGELTLRAYAREHGLRAVSCRYSTVYGERGHENLAVIAMIARAFVRQDPFVVWGDGEQVRSWTHVSDIVAGTIRAAEVIEDGLAVNLGTMERIRVRDAVAEVIRLAGYQPRIELRPDMPTGPLERVSDNALARRLLGWEPGVLFMDGLRQTLEWYFGSKERSQVAATLERRLLAR